jgi:hypothetical protein
MVETNRTGSKIAQFWSILLSFSQKLLNLAKQIIFVWNLVVYFTRACFTNKNQWLFGIGIEPYSFQIMRQKLQFPFRQTMILFFNQPKKEEEFASQWIQQWARQYASVCVSHTIYTKAFISSCLFGFSGKFTILWKHSVFLFCVVKMKGNFFPNYK